MTATIRDQESALPQGFTLGGRYQIQRELGRGGIGVVYLATDEQLLSRQVVVKVIHDHYFRDEWIVGKFRQEMEALSRIDHPGVVSVLDAGQTEDAKPFIVMQYIDGVLLRSQIKPEGMEFSRASILLIQMGDALEAAHNKGVLHRDLKPENIMIQKPAEGKEQIKLIDFGLAKVAQSKTSHSTAMPVVAGSFGYMSPEQLSAKPVTRTSDVYSLAVITFEMITGRLPYEPESIFELYHLQQKGRVLSPRSLRSDIPEMAELVLMKALSFRPDQRQQSAVEFTQQAAESLQGRVLSIPYVPPETFSTEENSPFQWMPWSASLFLGIGLTLAMKSWMYRFSDWNTYLTSVSAAFFLYPFYLLLILAPIISSIYPSARKLSFLFGSLYLMKTGIRLIVVLLVFLLGIFSLLSVLMLQPVISISSVPGAQAPGKYFYLNYSDPKGYKYTTQDWTFRIRLDPGGWNELRNYSIEIILSPEIEFSDLYLDKRFQIFQQLTLQPSSTNDVIRFEKNGDHFQEAREIAFTCKFRREPAEKKIKVTVKNPEVEITYETDLP